MNSFKKSIKTSALKEDLYILLLSSFISFLMVFLFDIHWSFYTWPLQLKFIFNSIQPYIYFISIGSMIGFFTIKTLFYIFIKEEQLYKTKLRKTKIEKEELIIDSLFLLISAIISTIIIFLIDIHHGLYQYPFKLTYIFHDFRTYITFISLSSVTGMILLKTLANTISEKSNP